MGDLPKQPDQPPVQAGQVLEKPCPKCKGTITLQIPSFDIVNTPRVSMLVFPHEQPEVCVHCGATMVFRIGGALGIDFGFKVIEEKPRNIIVPPSSGKIIIPN